MLNVELHCLKGRVEEKKKEVEERPEYFITHFSTSYALVSVGVRAWAPECLALSHSKVTLEAHCGGLLSQDDR